ncbi:MAG TPA: isochorismatase family cysteine hydrolase [Rhizomicrobium sp.]|nr:isochorismatase family cysteine hydrolase [Rhizomicrobium sp.]
MKADWIAPKRTAVLVIDCQVDFGAPDGEMAKRGADMTAPQAALEKAQALVEAARAASVEVVFVRLITNSAAESAVIHEARVRQGEEGPELCLEGTHGAEFIGPQPLPGDIIISKKRYSAFVHTGLAEELHAKGVDTLVLAGLTTECCVASSAWDGFEQDFHVLIAEDACAAYEQDLHRHALKALAASGAVVADTATFINLWKMQ